MILRENIHMRDPYMHVEGGTLYLYGTTDDDCWRGEPQGFKVYIGNDLNTFQEEKLIFAPSEAFWGKANFWAPELHVWQGSYYLFASFKAPGVCRGTSILKADKPEGPFAPWGSRVVTPEVWECLDGTLYVDSQGKPWVVFCHEWVQIGDGAVCAQRLTEDLSAPTGMIYTLFTASTAPWAKQVNHSSGISGYVTDGPFLYRPQNGELWLLWSSLAESGYAIGLARSVTGHITGPWVQSKAPLYSGDGGHGMVFTGLDGQLYLTIHTPNKTPDERPIFIPLQETKTGLVLAPGGC